MMNLASVDIVFTNDKSKWTRCPVIEMGIDPVLTEGGAKRFALRNHPSVDKEGNEITILDILKTKDPDYLEDIYVKDNIVLLKKYL